MQNLGYYNGKIGLIEQMTVPMNDRSSWFGDGVYDATYCRNRKIYMLKAHIDRFFNSAGLLKIKIPHTKSELASLLESLVKKVDSPEQFVYWQVTRADEGSCRSHNFTEPAIPGNMWVTLRPKCVNDTYEKIRLITMPDTRFLHCNIKTLNLIPSVMATHAAAEKGCYETVFHRNGIVTECAHSNVSILKDGIFRTAPTDNLILPGIARANLIRFCKALNIRVYETPFTVGEMMEADEVIVSSSGSFCLAATEIDGIKVGGKATKLLKSLQDAAVEDFTADTAI